MNKVALFDIDYTLFDTDRFIAEYRKLLKKRFSDVDANKLMEIVEDAYQKTRRKFGYFESLYFCKEVVAASQSGLNPEELERDIFSDKMIEESLYKETMPVFHELQKLGIQFGIFSTGHISFQKRKIKSLEKFLPPEHIHIFALKDNEIGSVLKQYSDSQVFLIDDYLPVLYAAKKADDALTTIWVKRGRFSEMEHIEKDMIDGTVSNLEEIVPILVGE